MARTAITPNAKDVTRPDVKLNVPTKSTLDFLRWGYRTGKSSNPHSTTHRYRMRCWLRSVPTRLDQDHGSSLSGSSPLLARILVSTEERDPKYHPMGGSEVGPAADQVQGKLHVLFGTAAGAYCWTMPDRPVRKRITFAISHQEGRSTAASATTIHTKRGSGDR